MKFTGKILKHPVFQYLISIASIAILALAAFPAKDILGYHVIALLLLMAVSLLAMAFDILPVLLSAALSGLIWNFFFIPPIFTFHVDLKEDWLMFLMYFVIALLNAVLTFKIRQAEKRARDKEEKDKSIRLYNTLLNSLSHELRTPIATILGAVGTLKDHADQLSKENRNALFEAMDGAALRLNRQVENLLNMSRVESGMIRLHKDWCDLNEWMFSIIHKIKLQQVKQPISFEPDDNLPLFKIDAVLMEEVVYNLLMNAALYTPETAPISVQVGMLEESCCIRIADQGKGFPQEEIAFAFDKFHRLPGTKTGGTGLGLSIAKGFTEAHGGQIQLQNRPQGGALFTILLPAESSYVNRLKND